MVVYNVKSLKGVYMVYGYIVLSHIVQSLNPDIVQSFNPDISRSFNQCLWCYRVYKVYRVYSWVWIGGMLDIAVVQWFPQIVQSLNPSSSNRSINAFGI